MRPPHPSIAAPEPVQVIVDSGATAADWVSATLTAALVVITAVYAYLTHRMGKEMERQSAAIESSRLREKSDRAAYECLEAVNGLMGEFRGRPPGAVDRARFSQVHLQLRKVAPLIHDAAVRDKVSATAEVLHVASLNDEQIHREELDRAVLPLLARDISEALTRILHAHVSEEDVPANLWARGSTADGHTDFFPDHGHAWAWTRAEAAKKQ